MVVLHCLQVITGAISAWFGTACKSSLVLFRSAWYYLQQVTCNAVFLCCLSESEYWQQAQGGAQEQH
ncbi:hypothetical protein G6F42_025300 [Rhizopus arrhizus]|nr:hypothetical protein G6F42_025300 [Rhizopus arrhizus]